MLVIHPASLCDVCLDPYIISSELANSPHVIACGHIFCLTCLRNLSPSACPLCRKTFQPDRIKKLHVAGPPELDGAAKESIEEEATNLLQRVVLVSDEGIPEGEIAGVVTEVEGWLSDNAADDNSHRPLRTALAALKRYKALQERNERENAEHRRVRRELKAYRRNAHQDSKTSRAVEGSLLSRIDEMEQGHAQAVSQDGCEQGQDTARLTSAFQLSRLHAEIDSLRGDQPQPSRNVSNPLPPPPEPLPLDRFPPFARPGGATDITDPLLSAVPYPPPPPRVQPTPTSSYPPVTSHTGTSYVPTSQSLAVPRARYAKGPPVDEWGRSEAEEVNGADHPQEERRLHAESSRSGVLETRYANADGRPPVVMGMGPPPGRRVVVAPSPAPSWAHRPLVEERKSDEEREVEGLRPRVRTNGTNGVIGNVHDENSRLGVSARLASAEAYVQGYGSGYTSGFHIASEPPNLAPSSYGSDRPNRVHGFPVQESPGQPTGGLGLIGVPRPTPPGTVSTPDEDATPVNRPGRLARRNTTQAVELERSTRRLDDQPLLDVPQNGGVRRTPAQTMNQVLGVRRTVTEGALHRRVNGSDETGRRRTMNGVIAPLSGENESPRSETTWGTVQTLSMESISGGSMGSLGLLIGLHNGGVRGQASVAGESYVGREDLGDNVTSEDGEDGRVTPIVTGSLPGSDSDVSSLGLIREDEREHTGSRNGHALEGSTPRHRSASSSERNPEGLETTQDRRARRARRNERTGEHRRHASQTSTTEALRPDSRRAANGSDIIGTNALSLHFDASFPMHDHQSHMFSAPAGPEIFAPTPIVGGPNIIQLWANRA